MKRAVKVLGILLVACLLFVGCKKEEPVVNIAHQYGLAYAPIQVMKELGLVEKALPDREVNWKTLGNTAAIREAMLSDKVQIGFLGIPPFLIAKDKGMDWKMVMGLSRAPLGLVTNKDDIKSLKDITFEDKIALPQPGSIQHILLSMAAENELGDAKAFDQQLVTLKHPDGVLALEAGREISAHFTSPPFLFQELSNSKNHLVISGEEAMGGEFTFIVGVCREQFKEDEEAYIAVKQAVVEAMDYMNTHPDESIELLAKAYNLEKELIAEYLTEMVYEQEIKGLETFVSFMTEQGYLSKSYNNEELVW